MTNAWTDAQKKATEAAEKKRQEEAEEKRKNKKFFIPNKDRPGWREVSKEVHDKWQATLK